MLMPAVQESRPCAMGAADKARGGAGMSAPHRLPELHEARIRGMVGKIVAVLRVDGYHVLLVE